METFTWSNLMAPKPGISSGTTWNPARYLPGSMRSVNLMASQNAPTIFTPIGKKRRSRSNHWM